MTADEIKQRLDLVPHPREGGWYVRTYESAEMVALDRYGAHRRIGTAIYYLLEPGTFSEMHRLASDEIFHFYAGDPVEMLQLRDDGSGRVVTIGNDLAAGERPQVLVERGVWQGSRLREGVPGRCSAARSVQALSTRTTRAAGGIPYRNNFQTGKP